MTKQELKAAIEAKKAELAALEQQLAEINTESESATVSPKDLLFDIPKHSNYRLKIKGYFLKINDLKLSIESISHATGSNKHIYAYEVIIKEAVSGTSKFWLKVDEVLYLA